LKKNALFFKKYLAEILFRCFWGGGAEACHTLKARTGRPHTQNRQTGANRQLLPGLARVIKSKQEETEITENPPCLSPLSPFPPVQSPQSAMEKTNHGWTRMDTDGMHFSLFAFIRVHLRFKSAIRNPQSAIGNPGQRFLAETGAVTARG